MRLLRPNPDEHDIVYPDVHRICIHCTEEIRRGNGEDGYDSYRSQGYTHCSQT